MDQQQNKNKLINEIKKQIERNKSRIYGGSQAGSSAFPQGGLGENSGGAEANRSGSVSGGDLSYRGAETSGKETADGQGNNGRFGDRIRDKASGIKKGLNTRADNLKAQAKSRALDAKKQAEEKIKSTAAYSKMTKIQEDALRIKQETQRKAQENIEKLAGETGKQVKRFNAKANEIRSKIAAKKKALAAALKANARKSHASGNVVALVFIVTLVLAIVVDVIDVAGELLVEIGTVPTIIAYIINLCSSIIIAGSWFLIFSGSRGNSTAQTRMIIRSVLFLFGLENIPIIELLPFNALAVIFNYRDYRAGQKEEEQ